jgi:maleylacetoacetate isomerase
MSISARTLHSYFRSSASYRVRIALALKALDYRVLPVHLLKDGGQQHQPSYRALNPFALVPSFEEDGHALQQSLAIIEYLEERHPEPALLPGDAWQRARIRQFALAIACDIHPLSNLRVLQYLSKQLQHSEADKLQWIRHWTQSGLQALEATLAQDPGPGPFCMGTQPTLADCCLVPQLYNARRFGVELGACPRLQAIDAACAALPAFQQAHPSQQVDAE